MHTKSFNTNLLVTSLQKAKVKYPEGHERKSITSKYWKEFGKSRVAENN